MSFLHETVYPALFERIDTAFPEFGFVLRATTGGRVWLSTTGERPDGHTGSKGKTYISERAPGYINDHNKTRSRTIWEYVASRKGHTDNRETFAYLCELASVSPRGDHSEAAAQQARRSAILEAINRYFLDTFHDKQEAQPGRDYLKQRGGFSTYTLRQLDQPPAEGYTGGERAEIGYFSGLPALAKHLREIFGESPDVLELLPDGNAAGRLSLTMRECGRIVGFQFRAISEQQEPKYLFAKGYAKSEHLPGLRRGCKEVILVEGVLDAMAAKSRGFLDVAAIGGASLSVEQIKKAIQAGAKKITLALDNDTPGKEGTEKATRTLCEYIQKTGADLDIFVCKYPEGCKDFDELLRLPDGASRAADMLRNRKSIGRYMALWLQNEGAEPLINEAGGDPTNDLFRAAFARAVGEVETRLPVGEIPAFRGEIAPILEAYQLDSKTIQARADDAREAIDRRNYSRRLADISRRAADAADKGDTQEAERLLQEETSAARIAMHSGRFAALLEGHTRADVVAGLNPAGLKTSYPIKPETGDTFKMEIPAGAISVFAAASGHGKTAMLINLMLDLLRRYQDKEFHFFSLEESAPAVVAKMLNTWCDMDFSGRNEPALEAYLKGDPQFVRGKEMAEFQEKERQFFDLMGKRLFVHYIENASTEQFCDAVQWLHKRGNVGAVFADYFQLLNIENRGRMDRQQELKQICLAIKQTAVNTGLPLVFAAQYSRSGSIDEKTSQKYTNIGEAGDIERIAALIVGLWNRTFNQMDNEGNGGPSPYMAAKILKWRGGPVGGTAEWSWNGNRKRIYSAQVNPSKKATSNSGFTF